MMLSAECFSLDFMSPLKVEEPVPVVHRKPSKLRRLVVLQWVRGMPQCGPGYQPLEGQSTTPLDFAHVLLALAQAIPHNGSNQVEAYITG